ATALNGRYLKKADLGFSQHTMAPEILLEFNDEGADLFEQITSQNIGKRLAIFIDDALISAPTVNEAISGGKAQITGSFTVKEAQEMVRNFNAGALPVPINLISQTTVGPSLGMESLNSSLRAGLLGFLAVCLFMIAYYRFSGLLASLALAIYALILLSLFKVIPITLTLAGIGAAILSVGMAVDANVLIFERQKEERKKGENFKNALENGFTRAWPSIRDSNLTTLLIALIMFSFGSSFVKGFAVALGLGVLVSMFSAIFITRTLMRIFIGTRLEKVKWLWK
ncbi:MAG: protein translocase subunit SecD, partial [Candidatus Pacebacteria bacterium]|nr:protein translocase subunit SecD [Candidatus Paceibacterota bacterium]